MSFQDVETVLTSYIPKVPGFEQATLKLVLLAIAKHTNSKDELHKAWPSLETLSEITQLAQSAVSRSVDALLGLGAFKEYERGGGRKHSTYWLDMEVIERWYEGCPAEKSGDKTDDSLDDTLEPKEPSLLSEEPCLPSQKPSLPRGGTQPSSTRTESGFNPVFEFGLESGSSSTKPPVAARSSSSLLNQEQSKDKTGNPVGALSSQAKTKAKPKATPPRCGNPDCLELLIPGEKHVCWEEGTAKVKAAIVGFDVEHATEEEQVLERQAGNGSIDLK